MTTILSRLQAADRKGDFLEQITEDILNDLNFENVKRQKSGTQYGYDIVAYKDNLTWKIECKNLNREATINDLSPKLIWHFDNGIINRFVFVLINGISNDLHFLLEQVHVKGLG